MFKNTANLPKLQIFLANPRGFCAGVERAVEIVERTILKYGAPVYVRHEIVHNKYVVEGLRAKGAIFVEEISEIPENAVTIFSAHGVSEKVENKSKDKNLKIIDATCPLVKKVHLQAQKFEKEGDKVILIGHKNHPEIEGTSGRVKQEVFIVENISDIDNIPYEEGSEISYVTQTTLSVDDTKNIINKLKSKFPNIKGPELNNICYATQNRQDAVKKLAIIADTVFVIGAKNSSNSNRLKDIAENFGAKSYLLNGEDDEIFDLLINTKILGITASASAPEILIENLINKIKIIRDIEITNLKGIEENIKFKIPKEL
jgi:4-hydroxy-3-methylbut-2-en-1-yl diphosphate reductase